MNTQSPTFDADLAKWIASRPKCVQDLAAKYSIKDVYEVDGKRAWLVAYNESDMLGLSFVDPNKNYGAAMATRFYACAKHFKTHGHRHIARGIK